MPASELHPNDEHEALARRFRECLAHPLEARQWELRKLRADGQEIWVREHARVLDGTGGEKSVLIVSEDITEERRLAEELSHQASHDSLTGLANRRAFERCLHAALEEARSAGAEHTLCYLY